jgi:hypothetical protein
MSLIPSPTQVLVWFDLTASGNDQGPFGLLGEDLDALLLEDGSTIDLENDVGDGLGFFTLDDSVSGLLDSDYVLAGDIAQDITSHVQSITLNRGRSAQILGDVSTTRTAHSTRSTLTPRMPATWCPANGYRCSPMT